MKIIKETTLHPEGNDGVDLYPKTNINQVQELPQKLTSVENQINQLNIDKLTKPTTPTADSAVTMLADGTVGTKLLSEIGGGGKLYRHNIYFFQGPPDGFYITVYSSKGTAYTPQTFVDEFLKENGAIYGTGYLVKSRTDHMIYQLGNVDGSISVFAGDVSTTFTIESFSSSSSDTVTEL